MFNALSQQGPRDNEKIDWGIVLFLLIAHGLTIVAFFNFTWTALAAFAILYVITGVGITFGFHRLFTHRSFKVPKWIQIVAAVCGTLALQGSLLKWVAHHRMHHAFSDRDKDPHNSTRGFWFSHIFWTCYNDEGRDSMQIQRKFGRDITADKALMFISNDVFMVAAQTVLLIGLWVFGGWEVMLWGVWVRLVALYHATWFVNSASHLWGYRNYEVEDKATNCWWVGLLTFGEGWHNNHHAFSDVAPAGHRWWELDTTWMLIKTLRFFGLATDVKTPPPFSGAPDNPRWPQAVNS